MSYYYCPQAGKIKGQRITLADRIRMRRARKKREREWKPFWG